jgi:hypothetical protein
MVTYPILYDNQKIKFGKLVSSKDILYLFRTIFNRNFREDLLHWFASCPTGANQWYGAFDGDIPIGIYGLLPIQVSLGYQIYNAALCNNVGITPAFQGKGLFQSLGQYSLDEGKFPLVIGVPNSKAAKGHKRIGWKQYGVLELLRGNTGGGDRRYSRLENFKYYPHLERKYFYVINNFDFIKWRYSKPGFEYLQSIFSHDKHIIFKVYEERLQVLKTNDFKLVFELGGDVDIWQFQNSYESTYLKNNGFKSAMSNEFIVYGNESLTSEFSELSNESNSFCFELGDNDVF